MPLYQIFDSLDRECGQPKQNPADLYGDLKALQEEEEEEPRGLTYAIGKTLPDGNVTFDF